MTNMKKCCYMFLLAVLLSIFTGCGGPNWMSLTEKAIEKEINTDVIINAMDFGVSEGSSTTTTGGTCEDRHGLFFYKFMCTFDSKTNELKHISVNGPFRKR